MAKGRGANNYSEPGPLLENDNVHNGNPKKECNDVFFLILFLGVFIMTLVFAVAYGPEFVDATKVVDDATDEIRGFNLMLEYILYCGLAAIGMSFVWIGILIVAGEFLIWVALLLIIALNIFIAYFFSKRLYDENVDYYWWPAVVFGAFALLTAMYACCIRRRVKFAAAHLKVAGAAILSLPMTLIVSFVMVFVQFAWFITWILGCLGIMFKQDYITVEGECTVDGGCTIEGDLWPVFGAAVGMFFVYFWGAIVIRNIVHVTTAGTMGAWKIKSGAPLITIMAWVRSMTLSLGSICFGSLFVAILETIRQILNFLSSLAGQSGNCCASCLLACVSCIVGCIESMLEFFNRFAYAYVGIYGYSFLTAGRHTWDLFANKGWSAIVNDDLTGNVFFIGNLLIGGLSAWIGVSFANGPGEGKFDMESPEYLLGFAAFVLGYTVCSLFMAVLASAVTAVFVLWAEDPRGWQLTHPEHYESLHSAWLEIYPDEYNEGLGKGPGNQA